MLPRSRSVSRNSTERCQASIQYSCAKAKGPRMSRCSCMSRSNRHVGGRLFHRPGFRLPAAAQRLVEIDHGKQLVPPGRRELIFRGIELLLSFQDLEIACPPSIVANEREINGLLEGLHLTLEVLTLPDQRLLGDQRVGGFLECSENRLAVFRDGLVPIGLAVAVLRFESPAGEYWAGGVKRGVPEGKAVHRPSKPDSFTAPER